LTHPEERHKRVKLKVEDSLRNEENSMIVRMDPEVMNQLDIKDGDVIKVIGRNSIEVICKSLPWEDKGKRTIRIGTRIRTMILSPIGDDVQVEKMPSVITKPSPLQSSHVASRSTQKTGDYKENWHHYSWDLSGNKFDWLHLDNKQKNVGATVDNKDKRIVKGATKSAPPEKRVRRVWVPLIALILIVAPLVGLAITHLQPVSTSPLPSSSISITTPSTPYGISMLSATEAPNVCTLCQGSIQPYIFTLLVSYSGINSWEFYSGRFVLYTNTVDSPAITPSLVYFPQSGSSCAPLLFCPSYTLQSGQSLEERVEFYVPSGQTPASLYYVFTDNSLQKVNFAISNIPLLEIQSINISIEGCGTCVSGFGEFVSPYFRAGFNTYLQPGTASLLLTFPLLYNNSYTIQNIEITNPGFNIISMNVSLPIIIPSCVSDCLGKTVSILLTVNTPEDFNNTLNIVIQETST